jgi:hypothetical protein
MERVQWRGSGKVQVEVQGVQEVLVQWCRGFRRF